MDWMNLAQDSNSWRAFVNKVIKLSVTQNAGSFRTSCTANSFSERTLLHLVSSLEYSSP